MPLETGRFGRNTHWHVTPVSISITSPEGSNPALVPSNSEGPTVQTHLVAAVLVRHAHARAERRIGAVPRTPVEAQRVSFCVATALTRWAQQTGPGVRLRSRWDPRAGLYRSRPTEAPRYSQNCAVNEVASMIATRELRLVNSPGCPTACAVA